MTATCRLPTGVVWQERSFPDANFLLLQGEHPTLVDTGFVAHAEETVGMAREYTSRITRVINTHWHSDHVGGNALLQSVGAEIIGSAVDSADLGRRDPGCCSASRLDQPVAPYTIDRTVADGDRVLLGDLEWVVLAVPGHTPGHLAFHDPEHGVLVVGDVLSSYDVGWVDIAAEGATALDDAAHSIRRLQELDARVVLPGHGPAISDPATAIAKALDRIDRQRANLDLAVMYGAKRILAFALMIHGGMTPSALDSYLSQREWARGAAETVNMRIDEFTRELVDSMIASGALTLRHGAVHAAADSTPVDRARLAVPFPPDWPKLSESAE